MIHEDTIAYLEDRNRRLEEEVYYLTEQVANLEKDLQRAYEQIDKLENKVFSYNNNWKLEE